MKLYDQHVHTNYSFDSDEPIENYIKRARELGISFVVTTDHIDFNYVDDDKHPNFDIKKQQNDFENIQKQFKDIKILKGVEIGYQKDRYDIINKLLTDNNFDLVNLSLHVMDGLDFYNPLLLKKYSSEHVLENYFKDYKALVNSGLDFDVCSHIDYAFKSVYLIDKSAKLSEYESELKEIIKDIIRLDKTLEINVKVQSMINDEHTLYLLKLYKSLGGKNLTLSSDAHDVSRYCYDFDHYIALIKEVGFDHLNYFINRKRYNLDI